MSDNYKTFDYTNGDNNNGGSGGGDELLYVTFTPDADTGDIVCDKTPAEILEAYESGMNIIGKIAQSGGSASAYTNLFLGAIVKKSDGTARQIDFWSFPNKAALLGIQYLNSGDYHGEWIETTDYFVLNLHNAPEGAVLKVVDGKAKWVLEEQGT